MDRGYLPGTLIILTTENEFIIFCSQDFFCFLERPSELELFLFISTKKGHETEYEFKSFYISIIDRCGWVG